MIKDFCLAWEKNKGKLEEYFKSTKQSEYGRYEDLVKLLFDIVINPSVGAECGGFDTEKMVYIDDGDYQGTMIFVLHRYVYQPCVDDYVYTSVGYGSCSCCDTLQGIKEYNWNDIPNTKQVEDYMSLCLHLLQRCNFMVNKNDEVDERCSRV